jgi:diaminopropionate ammonia-lyase
VTATDGNHGRGVARVASWLGIGAEVFVPSGTSRSRIDGIESEGAQVRVVSGDYDTAVEAAASRAAGDRWLIQDTAWQGYERVPALIVDGYSTIMEELDAQFAEMVWPGPDVVVVQIGVGSLAAAVTRHLRSGGGKRDPVIVGVEPEGAACAFESAAAGEPVSVPGPHTSVMAGLNCGTLSSLAWPVIRDGVDIFVKVSDEEAFESMRMLAADGIVSGESGSAGLAGLHSLLGDPAGREALEKYGVRGYFKALAISTEGITDQDMYRRAMGG